MSGCFGYFCVLNNALLVCCRALDIKDNLMTTSPLTYWSFLYNAHYLTLRKIKMKPRTQLWDFMI